MWNPSFSHWVVHVAVFGVLCWLLDSAIASLRARRPISRGLLFGPWQPLRGVFALWLTALPPGSLGYGMIPILAVGLGLAVDLLARGLLRKIFAADRPPFPAAVWKRALAYAFAGALLRLVAHPGTQLLETLVSSAHLRSIGGLLVLLLGADLVVTLYSLARLPEALDAFSAVKESEPAVVGTRLHSYRLSLRLLAKTPGLSVPGQEEEALAVRAAFEQVREAYRKREAERIRQRMREERLQIRTAWRTLTATNIVWMFLIGSVAGFVIETMYCLVLSGTVESRQGMLYGPFSQIYGFGAIILAAVLLPLKARGAARVFFGSMVLGGVYEAGASWIQEKVFHTVSWVYSGYQIPLFGGRTSLLYMLFWGILGVVFMQWIYPRMIGMIQKVPKCPKHALTWAIVVLLGADLLLSGVVVQRWAVRTEGRPPVTRMDRWIDSHYTDSLLREIYPNMRFPKVPSEKNP